MKQKTRFLSILALLLVAVTGAWAQVTYDEISPEGGESNAELNCTSFSISGTSNAGTGKNISPMTNKGFMVRKSNPLVMTINEGYRINAVTAYAAANDKLLPFQITKIEVDGVEYVPTGKTMPITCAQKNASEATAIEITGIAATDNITFTFGGTATLGIIELHVNYSIPAAEPEGPATFTATLAKGTEDADKWTITPNSGLKAGDQVTIQYNGTKRIKSVTAVQVAAAAEEPEEATTHAAGDVESATMGTYSCAKVYTSTTNGYYIMCTDQSTSCDWSTACGYSVSAGGNTFTCGSKAEWDDIMSTCGSTGYSSINSKCSGVTGWSNMAGYYFSSTENGNSYARVISGSSWAQGPKTSSFRARLISAF